MITFLLTGCAGKQTGDVHSQNEFHLFLNEIFAGEVSKDSLTLHYLLTSPETFGIKVSKISFGNFGTEEMKRSLAESENYRSGLKSFSYDSLNPEQQLIYDMLIQSFDEELAMSDLVLFEEALGPTSGVQAQLPILLAEYSFHDAEDIENYIALLNCVDDYFVQIGAFEKEKSQAGLFMSDATADSIIAQCRAFVGEPENNFLITYFDEKLEKMEDLSAQEKEDYRSENREAVLKSVIPAYEHLSEVLESLKGSGTNDAGLCHYDGGKDYYELLIKSKTGSSRSVEEIKKLLAGALKDNLLTLAKIAGSTPDIYSQYDAMVFPETDPELSLEFLKDAAANDFPAVGDVECDIRYVHKSLQDYLSPAMYLVPPIDDYAHNTIYVNAKPSYDLSGLFPTIAHEGYPGHLYQNVYFRSKNPESIRSLLDVTGYSEGWATYVELYSYEFADISPELAAFLQANVLATHCLYSLSDIGIHAEGWSLTDTASFLANYGFDAAAAETIFNIMVAEPGMYLPYSVGCLEILELREKAEKKLGNDFNLKDFHTFFLDIGPAPFSLIEERMVQWMEEY